MATKLKNLHLTKVDAVDAGANPGAHITLFKRKDGGEGVAQEAEGDGQEALFKRFCEYLVESGGYGQEEIAKQADGFLSVMEEMTARKIKDEAWMMVDALSNSIMSILDEGELDAEAKQAALTKSIAEFSGAISGCFASWCSGKAAGIMKKDGGEPAKKLTVDNADPDTEEKEDVDEGGRDDKEGDEDDMRIDKSKMSAEDRNAYEELVRKYASGDDGEETVEKADQGTVEKADDGAAAANDEVSKAIKEELESLKKFRQELELQQMETFAKKYEAIGKKPDELAKKLMAAKSAGGTAYDDMVSMLDEMLALQDGLFTEIGKSASRTDGGASGAWDKIEKKADEIQQAKPGISRHQAIDMACIQNPELVHEYESGM